MTRFFNTLSLSSLAGSTLLLASLLSTSATYAAQSGNWSGTSTNVPPPNGGGGSASAGAGISQVDITLVTTHSGPGEFETAQETMGSGSSSPDVYSESSIIGAASLRGQLRWGNDGSGISTLTFTFDHPVTNPVLHIDKLGGGSRPTGGTYLANSALITLTQIDGSAAVSSSLTRLSGVGHFIVDETNNEILRQTRDGSNNPIPLVGTSFSTVNWECSTDTNNGTACGSVRINGTGISSVTFEMKQFEDPGGTSTNDLMEYIWSFPVIAVDDDLSASPVTSGAAAVENVLNVLTATGTGGSDTLIGIPVDTGMVTITTETAVPPELSFDTSDGSVDVAANAPAGTYTFDYKICETVFPTYCDTATVTVTVTISASPNIILQKTSLTLSDPVNGTTNPKAIPGALSEYAITATNSGTGTADNNSIIITDSIPANTALYVNDISGTGTGPIRFVSGSPPSGLSYSFVSLTSTTDGLSFSNDGGTTYTYVPSADADGVDTTVTNIRIATLGQFLASGGSGDPSFKVLFRVKVQ